MSRPKPNPKLPPGAQLDLYLEGLYRWRLPGEPWIYCVGRREFLPLCQEHPPEGALLLHRLTPHQTKLINLVLTQLGIRGSFHSHLGRIGYEERWPYPDVPYFPGMIIDRAGRVLNGAWEERWERMRFRQQLRLYTGMIHNYVRYRSALPLPDEGDCPFCRGVRTTRKTLYDHGQHDRMHLARHELFGTLLVNVMHEAGYGSSGTGRALGYLDQAADTRAVSTALEQYFKKRGGF